MADHTLTTKRQHLRRLPFQHTSIPAEESLICKYRRSLNIHPSIHPFSIAASRALIFAGAPITTASRWRRATVWTGRYNTTHNHLHSHSQKHSHNSELPVKQTSVSVELRKTQLVVTVAFQDLGVWQTLGKIQNYMEQNKMSDLVVAC